MSRWQEMDLGIKSQRTTYHSFPLRLVKRCQVLLDMAARNNVTASQTTPLIWPHLLVWERLAGPAEIENAFRQLTNESVALGYRSLPGGCAPSILWLTGLASQRFSDLLACCVLWTVLVALCNELCSLYAKVGGRICLQKQHWRWFPLSFFTSFCPSSSLSSLYPPLLSLLSCPPHPTIHTNTKTPYTSRFHITHCLLFSVLHPPPLVLSRRLSLLCGLIPTRGLFSFFCIVTTWLMQFLQKAIIVSRRAEPHTR